MSKIDFPRLHEENNITYLSNGNVTVEDIVIFIADGDLEATFRYNDQDCKFVLADNPEEHYLDIEGEWFRKLFFNRYAENEKTSSGFYYGYRYDLWLSPDEIFISREEAERFEKFGARAKEDVHPQPEQEDHPKGSPPPLNPNGAPRGALRKAIILTLDSLPEQTRSDVLNIKSKKHRTLLNYLKSMMEKENSTDPEEMRIGRTLTGLIEWVKPNAKGMDGKVVKIQRPNNNLDKKTTYTSTDVSTCLSKILKKNIK